MHKQKEQVSLHDPLESSWSWPPNPDVVVAGGSVDRFKLVQYLIQLCTGRYLKRTDFPVGYSFEVLTGRVKKETVTFSMPNGPAKMVKFSIPFEIKWSGPTSGSCSGVEQIFKEKGK